LTENRKLNKMNSQIMFVFTVVAAVATLVSSQAVVDVAEGIQASQGSALNVADNSASLQQAALNKEARQQARLDKKKARQERKNQRKALKAANRLAAQSQVDFADYTNVAEFSEVDAAADLKTANKFGLQIVSENVHDESARLSKSSGNQASTGTKLSAGESIDAADYVNAEEIDQYEITDEDLLSAAGAEEDILNANEGVQSKNQFILQAQDFSDFANFGRNSGGISGGFGGGFFNSGLFARRR